MIFVSNETNPFQMVLVRLRSLITLSISIRTTTPCYFHKIFSYLNTVGKRGENQNKIKQMNQKPNKSQHGNMK